MSSGCSVRSGERGPSLHGGRTVLIHSKNLCWSHPFKPETWRGKVGGMKSPPVPSAFFQTWLEKTQKTSHLSRWWYAHQPHQSQHSSQCAFWVDICMFFLRPFPLKLYFLNEAIASTDSGEFVFPTRALKLMKFSGLIFKMKSNRTKKGASTFFQMRFLILFTWKYPSRKMWKIQTHLYVNQNNFKYIIYWILYCVTCTYEAI